MIRRSTRFWFAYCAVLVALGAAYFLLATGAYAHDKDPPKPVVIVQHEHDNNALAVATAAGLSIWIACHRATHHPEMRHPKMCPKKK